MFGTYWSIFIVQNQVHMKKGHNEIINHFFQRKESSPKTLKVSDEGWIMKIGYMMKEGV